MSDKLIVKISDFNTPNAFKDLSRCIEQHYLNHKLELIIAQKPSSSSTTTTKLSSSTTPYPSSKTLLSEISSVWNGSCFHVVKATLASILFDNSFLNNYIRSGHFIAMSLTSMESTASFAILPNQSLLLRLDKITYQKFGMVGVAVIPPGKKKKDALFYDILVDLRLPAFSENSSQFQRLKWCLTNEEFSQFAKSPVHFLCFWNGSATSSSSSSIINQWPKEIEIVKTIPLNGKTNELTQLFIPTISSTLISRSLSEKQLNDEIRKCCSEFFEWIGFVRNDCEILLTQSTVSEVDFSSHSAGYSVAFEHLNLNEKNTNSEKSMIFTFKLEGFFGSNKIQETLEVLKKFFSNQQNIDDLEWITLYVSGFEESLISWSVGDRNRHAPATNDYSINFLLNNKEKSQILPYVHYYAIGSHDIYSP